MKASDSDRPNTNSATVQSSPHKVPVTRHPLQLQLLEEDTANLLRLSRSMMDDVASPHSNIASSSDDEDDGRSATRSSQLKQVIDRSTNNLMCLQQPTLPPIPDEQDRKRFVGCLAAVLASAYDYEHQEEHSSSITSSYTNNGSEHDNDSSGSDAHALHDYDKDNETSTFSTGTSYARHRRRRYHVLSHLLLSSADLLNVDKFQARAFIPMLRRLLSSPPISRSLSSVKNSSRSPPQSTDTDEYRGASSMPSSTSSETEPIPLDSNLSYADDEIDPLDDHDICNSGKNGYDDRLIIQRQIDRIEHLRPFLESMTLGAGFRCLTMFLLQHLMHSDLGYDARIRHSIKTLAVLLLLHDMEGDPVDVLSASTSSSSSSSSSSEQQGGSSHQQSQQQKQRDSSGLSSNQEKSFFANYQRIAVATRKFEALEQYVASKLLQLSHQEQPPSQRPQPQQQSFNAKSAGKSSSKAWMMRTNSTTTSRTTTDTLTSSISREQVVRGLKIGGAAVLAGTLFAVTGGLAAPGIAAGVAAVAGSTAAAATAVLTSTVAVTTIFGVGGGSLAAYKMQRRTQGLTEFDFYKESAENTGDLFLTVAISGWLRDEYDFQRPWGVSPSHPPLRDRLELLERFYVVHNPDHVPKCKHILRSWKNDEVALWKLLAKKYGRDPSHLFPLDGPRNKFKLTLEQEETIDQIFVELGYVASSASNIKTKDRPLSHAFERVRHMTYRNREPDQSSHVSEESMCCREQSFWDSLHGPTDLDSTSLLVSASLSRFETLSSASSTLSDLPDDSTEKPATSLPKHLATVWDYSANYGGELYTVKYEGKLLIELCDSVADLAYELVSGGTAQLLKHTALSTIMSAIAWPYALVNAANLIDGTWTLAVERSDAAGRELARSLLFTRAGRRPVTLIGFSFGARTIYSCLKELARYQEAWERFQEDGTVVDDKESANSLKQMREPASIVEDAVLMGLPNHLSSSSWIACRQIVAGRFINCYSQKDLVLSLMFQFKRLGLKRVCGTCPVHVSGVENINISDIVTVHQDYCTTIGDILKRARHGQPFSGQ